MKLMSQNWPIESRALFWSAGKTWTRRAAKVNCGKGNSAVWVDCIFSPLGSLIEMPCFVGTFSTQVLSGPIKWLVQPKSIMARRSTDGLRAGTKVLQENKLFKTKESSDVVSFTGDGGVVIAQFYLAVVEHSSEGAVAEWAY